MIGKRIQYYREQRRISITELANRAGVAKSYLSSIERNIQKNPSIEFLKKIGPVLGVDVETLVKEDDDKEYPLSGNDIKWLQFAKEVKDVGISIEDIRDLIEKKMLVESEVKK